MIVEKKIQSLRHAVKGINVAWKEENNFRLEIGFGILALVAAWFLGVSRLEFVIIVLLIGFVLSAETLNTALEEFCDMVQRNPDPHIAKIKDLAAAAVLIASFTSLIIGAVIFTPYLLLI
ncbi:MAG: diacylglycerol kinase family protein [bacterium]|nr:diacylglycerol kinase family protein [bacterium]